MGFRVSEIMTGAPEEFKSEIQQKIYKALEESGIEYTRVESDPGVSMEDCLNIDRAFGINTVKTILLTNRQKTKFWLYVTHAWRPFVTKDFGAALQIPRVSFADEPLMMQILGTPHGAATAFGLIRPEAKDVTFVMDKDVAERERIVITDSDACGFIAIRNKDLFRLLGKEPILIDNNSPIEKPEI